MQIDIISALCSSLIHEDYSQILHLIIINYSSNRCLDADFGTAGKQEKKNSHEVIHRRWLAKWMPAQMSFAFFTKTNLNLKMINYSFGLNNLFGVHLCE